MSENRKNHLLITAGEPAGIGTDCILRAWREEPALFERCVIVAPAIWLQERADQIDFEPVITEHAHLEQAASASHNGLRCWNPLNTDTDTTPVVAGHPAADTAAAVIGCIKAAARACLDNRADALITGPIEKAVLRTAGFNFPGHTEFLAHLARSGNAMTADRLDHVMMLASNQLRVALLTTHMALSEVPKSLSIDATTDCLHIVARDLRRRFGIKNPNIGLCGLNPHAGEQGHFGREEIDILTPAALAANEQGLQITGPLPADTLFSGPMRSHFDAIVCCYHDQALIPLKTLSFGDSVNITLGLPFIRTSVDHGTALDRVGKASVSCTSMLTAIHMAGDMAALDH
ncbi:MAG: 4-hydroxythreonine-4-phosphate dehydrogenase PdxA [Mariprofundus sp.]